MMQEQLEKIQYTLDDFNLLEKRVRDNIAKADEYKQLDKYLSSVTGEEDSYILNKMKESGILTYNEYVLERNKNKVDGNITGTVLGVIAALKRLLTNNLF